MSSSSRWKKGSLLGVGSFGKVNLAINLTNGELFAVKSVQRKEANRAELEALENEIRILANLKACPYILTYMGMEDTLEEEEEEEEEAEVEKGRGRRGGRKVEVLNMLMEFMPGGSLADLMHKFGGARIPLPLVLLYSRAILKGLEYIHRRGIVHCDVKAKNILVGLDGKPKLADFGAAKLVEELSKTPIGGSSSTSSINVDTQCFKGTPLWMAPEVVQQTGQGPASDVWSFGCTVLEMLTGRPPWSHCGNPLVALYKIACSSELPIDWARTLPHGGNDSNHAVRQMPPHAADFLLRCFQRDPSSRWTCSQLLSHPFLTSISTTTIPTTTINSQIIARDLVGSCSVTTSPPLSPTSTLDYYTHWSISSSSHPYISPPNTIVATPTATTTPTTSSNQQSVAVPSKPSSSPPLSSSSSSSSLSAPSPSLSSLSSSPSPPHSSSSSSSPSLSAPSPSSSPSDLSAPSPSSCDPIAPKSDERWIVVRSKAISGSSPSPCLSSSSSSCVGERKDELVLVKKGTQINLDCFSFLRNRPRITAHVTTTSPSHSHPI